MQLFHTCLVNDFFPEAGIAAVELLERAGCEVEVPRGQTCCGQPAWNAGFRNEARAVARHALSILAGTEGPIVVPSGSCADMLVHQTGELFRGDGTWSATASAVGSRVRELTQFLAEHATEGPSRDGGAAVGRRGANAGDAPATASAAGLVPVAYHPSCHLTRGLGVQEAPRKLLAAAPGIELVPLAEEEECCGFGGMFSVKQPAISGAMLDRKCAAIERSGAAIVASCDSGCLLHLAGGLRRRGSPARACHVAELLRGGARELAAPSGASPRESPRDLGHAAIPAGADDARARSGNPDRSAPRRAGVHGAAPPLGSFAERVQAAVADSHLHEAIGRATGQLQSRRGAAFASLEQAELVRDHARRAKLATLARLDEMLETFERNLVRNGIQVHWARDAEEACRIVVGIARSRGLRRAVKAKSMLTEEIHLNPALEAAGIEVRESDLGEYVVQLAHDRPSHIILPIIHLTREDVGRVMERTLAVPYTPEPKELCRIARGRLREEFLEADLGISGGNFGVVETGSICLVSNEGNIRMCTSLPRVHVALLGIEKLVPTLADLDAMLKVLARSATGQKITVYTSLVNGPRRHSAAAAEIAPEEVHVVLLDHGRSATLAGEEAEILACIRCGACLNACPVFHHIGGHAYGDVYPGPMGSVLTPALRGLPQWHELPQASSLCGACREVCPVRIDLPRLLLSLRAHSVEQRGAPRSQRRMMRAFAFLAARPRLFRWAWGVGGAIARWRARDGWVRRAPGLLAGWTEHRDLLAPTRRTFEHWWRERRDGGA